MVARYGDVDVATRVERESLDRLAQWLEATIGPRLTAYAAGVSTEAIVEAAHGENVADELDERLRNLYALTYYLAATDGPGSAHEWLLSPNPELDNHAPAEVLHNGQPPELVWVAAAPSF